MWRLLDLFRSGGKKSRSTDIDRSQDLVGKPAASPVSTSNEVQSRNAVALHHSPPPQDPEATYRELLSKHPEDVDLLLLLGTTHGQRGDFEQAARYIQQALTVSPNHAGAHGLYGNCLKGLGRYQEALQSFDIALKLDPGDVSAWINRGATLSDLRRYTEAVASYDKALSLQPEHVLALDNRGVALRELQRLDEALASHDRALAIEPNYARALHNRGLALLQMEQYSQALASLQAALSLSQSDPQLHLHCGQLLQRLMRHREAIDHFSKAIQLDSRLLDAYILKSGSLRKLQRFEDARQILAEALKLQPDSAEVQFGIASCLGDLGKRAEALTGCDRALQLRPDYPEALILRGRLCYESRRFDAALESYDRALSLLPDDVELACDRGTILREMGHHGDALVTFDHAIRINPDSAKAHLGRGVVLFELRQFDEAETSYAQAIKIQPEYADAHYYLSLCHLQRLDYARGWTEYEWRWKTDQFRSMSLPVLAPVWDGRQMDGSLLVWNEQGVGDEIFTSGLLEPLKSLVRSVTVCADGRLVPLLRRSIQGISVISKQALSRDARFDAQVASGSLARFLWPVISTSRPPTAPYLHACPDRTSRLRTALAQDGKLICGVSWISKNANAGSDKSLRLRDMQPIFALPNVKFVDLQYGDTNREREDFHSVSGVRLEHVDEIDNFSDLDGLAALIEACHLVVTVSNTTAHLAAALGKPVIVMLPYSKGLLWHWHADGESSFWYPTARLLRQKQLGDWTTVILEVVEVLSSWSRTEQASQ